MDHRRAAIPRRPPAHKSVSLRHSPRAGLLAMNEFTARANAHSSDKTNAPTSLSPRLAANKQSSGESSDAGKWYENANNNAGHVGVPFVDNDPPFFLRNSSSSETPPEGGDAHFTHPYGHVNPIVHRPGPKRHITDNSSNEDFRGVIDDLTVANKRLRQKLRKYERLYDAHLQDEKLFEVRFHALPGHKKRELEETLRKFVQNMESGPRGDHSPVALETLNSISTTSRAAESGYVSMSASGQNSASGPSHHDVERHRMSKLQYHNQQQQVIQTYLHDIPPGLLPKHNAPMTEHSKKKLVVRRLEQVFAGKRSTPGNHQQPEQQEEVAQSAAMADRQANEAIGKRSKEGHREALIMPSRSSDEELADALRDPAVQRSPPESAVDGRDTSGSVSPDQRPTRPLDLDPARAQVPADNVDYIRHLGFKVPDTMSEAAPLDDHGWVYLNLLINMAQLHTINVTPDFVKDAIIEYSSKFELSHDGRKVRWRGGNDVTLNSDSSSEHLSGPSPLADSNSGSSSKRLKTEHARDRSDRQAHWAARAAKEKERNKLSYTPMFFRRQDSEEEEDLYNLATSSSNSPIAPQQQGGSTLQSSSSRKRKDDGTIIFYKANFCTDLSGNGLGAPLSPPTSSYRSIISHPLGETVKPKIPTDTVKTKSLYHSSPMDLDGTEDEGLASSSEDDVRISLPDLRNDSSDGSFSSMEFEASGIGGVQPDDHFAIRVRRSHVQRRPSTASRQRSKRFRPYSKKIMDALNEHQSLRGDRSQSVIKEEILSTFRKKLPNSALPPASFLPFDSTSSGDADSDIDSEISSNPSTSGSSGGGPVTMPQFRNLSVAYSTPYIANNDEYEPSSGEVSDSESDNSDDYSAADPNTYRARDIDSDREMMDDAVAERFSDDIPAGNSAATASGGSGFNSPS